MKLIKTETISFKKGAQYPIEHTIGYPSEYFKKPLFKKDYFDGRIQHKKGDTDDFSDFDECVKSFKIVQKWYE